MWRAVCDAKDRGVARALETWQANSRWRPLPLEGARAISLENIKNCSVFCVLVICIL
jgi:hypothetical protein